jgi:hypothetical protein
MVFAGYDDIDNTTAWYTRDGSLDSITPTPDEDSQIRNEEGY